MNDIACWVEFLKNVFLLSYAVPMYMLHGIIHCFV